MSASTSRRAESPADAVDPDYPIDPVPTSARRSLFSLSVVLLGFTFFTPTMLAGAQIGAAFPATSLIWVLLLGSAVLGVYVGVIGGIGARTGLTTVMMCRYTLGTRGAKLASLLLGGTQVGWYGVTVATLAQLTASALGWEGRGPEVALMVVGGAVMGATAYFGYKGMYALSLVSVPLLLALAGWVTWRSLEEVGGWSGLTAIVPTETMTVAVAVTIVVGTFASGGTQAPNWTRFARTPSAGFWACLIAFLLGQLLMLGFGAIGAVAFGEGDFVLVLYQLGLVGWGLVFLVANLWTTNDNTAYNFGVAGAEIANSRSKKPFVVGGVVLGTLLAVTGIYDNLIDYLVWLGILVPPLGGVVIGDFLARWRGGMTGATALLPGVEWRNLAVYVVASLAAWASNEAGWGIPPVIGVVVAVVGVLAVQRGRRPAPVG
ncbi:MULTISPECIES: cytosine permease [unclassified Modestobacter]|uniref:cytosine permease n=1 Tax=unclassified Modestobacter TaxID=2643866 RepID=UPI0022AA1D90|nr:MULTISPECIES: cytosine permease [unclassified Modestobacter]MCZ2824448.1 cytosine permease [Modestobacter sp. VKM Ac-2981]MCZ2854024.1 cytosine permease [Modestobacter sp. VKM Ac-2982]